MFYSMYRADNVYIFRGRGGGFNSKGEMRRRDEDGGRQRACPVTDSEKINDKLQRAPGDAAGCER